MPHIAPVDLTASQEAKADIEWLASATGFSAFSAFGAFSVFDFTALSPLSVASAAISPRA